MKNSHTEKNTIINRPYKAASLVICALAITVSSIATAHDSYTTSSNQHDIQITNMHNKAETVYQVNGKTFGWEDLEQAQRDKLLAIEGKLKVAEKKLAINEASFSKVSKQLDEKAQEIEAAAQKMELATVPLKTEKISMKELGKLSALLAKKTKVHQAEIQQKSQELREIKKQLPKIDETQIQIIKEQAKALENALIEIANS